MTLASIKVGDVVLCDVRGQRFYALVTDKLSAAQQDNPRDGAPARGPIVVSPITAGVSYRAVRPREVVELFRKSRARRAVAA